MPREISSIKPDIKKLGKKKIVAGRTTTQQPEEIQFHYDTSAYDSFEKEGFNPPASNERFDVREREFLKRVNLDYGKIRVKILAVVRQKQVDTSTGESKERKEYLTFESEWYAHDYFGAEIRMGTHIEGQYRKQTRKLVNKLDMKTGMMNSWYEMGIPELTFNIPFTKENVDKYLLNPHPFGEDSENITDPNQVVYYGKFEHQDTSTMAHRDNTYNYEQFVDPDWRAFCDLTNRPGGPRGLLKNYRLVEENKPIHIT